MGKPTGFMEYPRRKTPWRDTKERLLDYYEIYTPAKDHDLKTQGARCMNCGIPFCESEHGCPIDNLIPEWNDLVYKNRWRDAYNRLIKTNNFPEFTGRVCPAPCEGACVLGINEPAVTIKDIENSARGGCLCSTTFVAPANQNIGKPSYAKRPRKAAFGHLNNAIVSQRLKKILVLGKKRVAAAPRLGVLMRFR